MTNQYNKKILIQELRKQNYDNIIPYHDEMGIEPPVAGVSLLHDSSGRSLVKKPTVKKMPRNVIDEESVMVSAKRQPPLVASGMNEEQMWMTDQSSIKVSPPYQLEEDEFDPSYDPNEEEFVDLESLQGLDNANVETYAYRGAQTLPRGSQTLPSGSQTLPKARKVAQVSARVSPPLQEEEEESGDVSLTSLNKGEFGVLVFGNLVKQSYDLSSIKDFVAFLVVKHEIDIDDVMVIKNFNIGFGITLDG